MAKRTRAPARRKPARTEPHVNSRTKPLPRPHGNRLVFAAELIADGKRRYETTAESLDSIGLDFNASRTTVTNIARREGWVRYVPPPRGLSNAARLATQAAALEEEARSLPPRSSLLPSPPASGRSTAEAARRRAGGGPLETAGASSLSVPHSLTLPLSGEGDAEVRTGGGDETPTPAWSMHERIDELRKAVDDEIAAVRALRATLKNVPHSTETAGRISHTLAGLTTTLERLHRLEIGAPRHNGIDAYDDMPADIDEFRERLARRIRAFVASRREPDPAAGTPAA